MKRLPGLLVLAAVSAAVAAGQTPAATAGDEKKPVVAASAATSSPPAAVPDPVRIEKFLRRYYSWPEAVKVTVAPLQPSPIAGLLEAKVKISHQGQEQETTFLVSADGRHLVQGPPIAMVADPFAAIRAKIDVKDSPALGSPLAQVTIVEYSDFQCGFCRGAAQILTGPVIKNFSSDVRLIFKDYPLAQIHAWATPAATLGRCIYKRYGDGFWPYHDWTFATQPQLTTQNFKQKALAFAKEKGMDTEHLGSCMDQPQIKAEVDRSMAEAESLGVTGTPTLFVNGRKVVGVQSFEAIREVIQAELSHVRGGNE